ncbi:MAG: BNR-4 repeat-containing protein [Flavobacteriales bacterium]|nr:BNR-4 repeat-containing protein [Flavobacteriales bacterium]
MKREFTLLFVSVLWQAMVWAQTPMLLSVAFDTLDTQAETFDGQWTHTVNANLATQDALTTYAGVQYASWFSTDNRLYLARKAEGQSTWETIVFMDYLKTSADSHNGIAIGICPNDGSLHLSFDNHNDLMNYRGSQPGLITGAVPWSASSFLPVQHTLYPVSTFTDHFTYPRFLTTPEGNLLLQYRSWVTEVNNRVAFYDGSTSAWTDEWKMVSGSGPYTDPIAGTCTSRRMYDNNLTYDHYGTLTTTFTWRENDVPAYNHDFAYMYSEDDGRSWKNNAHTVVSDANTGLAASYATPGMNVVSVPPAYAMINDQGHAVDPRGGIHIVANQADVPVAVYGFTGTGYYRHHWGKADGTWHTRVLDLRGDRPRLVCDAYGNLFLMYTYANIFKIATASPVDDYASWEVLYSVNLNIGNFFSVDHVRFRETGDLNLMAQTSPAVRGDPTPLFVLRAHLDYAPDPCGAMDEGCPAIVAELQPEDDAFTRGGAQDDVVFGVSQERILQAKDVAGEVDKDTRTYLRFLLDDYVNAGKLTRATLRLYVKNMPAGTGPDDGYLLRLGAHNFWTEESITHNSILKPGLTDTLGTAYANSDFLEYDITAVMRQELAGDAWVTFAVEGAGGSGKLVFFSKEVPNAAKWPVLTLEFASNVIAPEADAQVRAGTYANDNFGADQEMVIKENAGENYDRIAYLRFPVGHFAGSQPARVYLRMDKKAWSGQAVTTPYAAYPVQDDTWQEPAITFNNRPVLGDSLLDAHYGREAMRWDVTRAFNEATAGDGLLSLAVKSLVEGDARNVNVYSREFPDSTLRPRLVVLFDQALPATMPALYQEPVAQQEGAQEAPWSGQAHAMAIYPNPATDRALVLIPGAARTGVDLFAPTGALLRQYTTDQQGRADIAVMDLAPGLYLLRVRDGSAMARLVVQ